MNMQVCEMHRAEIEESPGGAHGSPSLREHLAACAPCEQFRRERASLRGLVGGLEKVAAPADFEFRLRARMAASEGARRARPLRFRFVPGVASVALAVCFVSVSAWVYLRREPVPNRPETPTRASAVAPAPESAAVKDDAPLLVGGNPSKERDELKEREELVASATPQRAYKVRAAASTFRARPDGKGSDRAGSQAGNDAVFEVLPAPILNASANAPGGSASTHAMGVAVRTPAVPLQVVLRDASGAARVVPMSSVSFGSQELVRQGRNAMPVSHTVKEGVW
jgi:hypothetical protein